MAEQEPEYVGMLRLHKRWADAHSAIWQIITVGLFVGVYILLDQIGVAPVERTDVFILLAAVLLSAAVWQAVGLGVYRVHLLFKGIDLELLGRRK